MLVPLVMIELFGAVVYRLAPVSRMETERAIGVKSVHGHPPILLARRSGIPCVAMRVDGIGKPRRMIASVRNRFQSRYIEICLLRITADVQQQFLDKFLARGVMNEVRL